MSTDKLPNVVLTCAELRRIAQASFEEGVRVEDEAGAERGPDSSPSRRAGAPGGVGRCAAS